MGKKWWILIGVVVFIILIFVSQLNIVVPPVASTYCVQDSDCVIVESRDESGCCWTCGYDAVNVEYSLEMRIADCDCRSEELRVCKTAPIEYYSAECNENVCEVVYVGGEESLYCLDNSDCPETLGDGEGEVWCLDHECTLLSSDNAF